MNICFNIIEICHFSISSNQKNYKKYLVLIFGVRTNVIQQKYDKCLKIIFVMVNVINVPNKNGYVINSPNKNQFTSGYVSKYFVLN
jgi:hypothetical protein